MERKMAGAEALVPVDGGRHPNQFKTLNLLRLFSQSGEPVYFVVEGSAILDGDNPLDSSFFYDKHSCPTNYAPVMAIMTARDDDPHGVFEYVRSVWMPPEYSEETIRDLFPEIALPVKPGA